jgi:hypothetical protein
LPYAAEYGIITCKHVFIFGSLMIKKQDVPEPLPKVEVNIADRDDG